MKTKRAFTLVELLVVISIIALLVAILMPGLTKAREMARRASCSANVSAVGKAISLYCSANKDSYMWLLSSGKWDDSTISTGKNLTTSPTTSIAYNASALLFLLIRDGQNAGYFICPSQSGDQADPNTKEGGSTYHWDFNGYAYDSQYDHVSYSYQCPVATTSGGTTVYTNGITNNSDPQVVILADRTPNFDLRTGQNANCNPVHDWTGAGDANVAKLSMSQNHSSGEYINVLYVDLHVGNGTSANLGVNKDCIYSDCTTATDTDDSQGSKGSADYTKHKSLTDSFLVGPVR